MAGGLQKLNGIDQGVMGVYVPLNPDVPAARLAALVEMCGAPCCCTALATGRRRRAFAHRPRAQTSGELRDGGPAVGGLPATGFSLSARLAAGGRIRHPDLGLLEEAPERAGRDAVVGEPARLVRVGMRARAGARVGQIVA